MNSTTITTTNPNIQSNTTTTSNKTLKGYARISTHSQNINLQVDQLLKYGIEAENIYYDIVSGKELGNRPELKRLLEDLKEDDTLIVASFSRLARSVKDFAFIIDELNKKNVKFISLSERINTSSASGKMMLNFLALLNEFERELLVERTLIGLEKARKQGKVFGRPSLPKDKIEFLKFNYMKGVPVKDIAKKLKIDRTTVYRYLKNIKEEENTMM